MTTWVLLAGLPATGKSTLAAALEKRLDAVILNKDRIREDLFPGRLTDYTSEQDDLCMRAILDAANYLTARNRTPFILFDGRCFSSRRQVDEILCAAELAGAAAKILHLTCTDAAARERLEGQNGAQAEHPAGNRNIALYLRIKQSFEPIPYPKLDVDTTDGVEANLNAVCAYLTGVGFVESHV
jgi:adenylylsulfate kinase